MPPVRVLIGPFVALVACAIAVPLVVLAAANASRPNAPEPRHAVEPPYLSSPDLPLTQLRLADRLQPLPLVDTSDGTDRPFVDLYNESPATDAQAMVGMLDAAIRELRVPDRDASDVVDFALSFVLQEAAPAVDDEPLEYLNVDFESDAWRREARAAMTALADDPANARAINDMAAGLVAISFATQDASALPNTTRPLVSPDDLLSSAQLLLELGLSSFPNDRAMAVNLAYVQSLDTGFDRDPEPVIAALEDHIERAPDDVTAQALLAYLYVRSDPVTGLEPALDALRPTGDDPTTEAALRVARGDALMFAADSRRDESPFLARDLTAQAVAEYDTAIRLSGNPGALWVVRSPLSGSAGSTPRQSAQEQALELAGPSPAWQLRLAQLHGCRGNLEGWRPASGHALELAAAAPNQPLARARQLLVEAPGQGYMAYSVGSDALAMQRSAAETGGGASIATLDPFPVPDCTEPESLMGGVGARAATEAALAAIEADDMDGARAAIDAWSEFPPPIGDPEHEFVSGPEDWSNLVEVLDGATFDEERDSFEPFLAEAWRLSPEAQMRSCRRLMEATSGRSFAEDQIALCVAEAATRAGDHAEAAAAMEPRIMLTDEDNPTQGLLAIQAGMLSELAGDFDVARTRYERGATTQDTAILGLTRLGDLELREDDPAGALDYYALALAAISSQIHGTQDFFIEEPPIRPIRQYLHNNRGIALLGTARANSKGSPDCSAHPDICSEAAAEFDIALESDPSNPIYLMNAAWVARLSGAPDRAGRLLARSLEQTNPLEASVRNDLGVLAARASDEQQAAEEFRAALALRPGHPLATWNLGVLLTSRAGPDALRGQAVLARAVQITPSFRADPLAYKLDETIYRVEVARPDRLVLADSPGGAVAVGGAVFGTVALVGALGKFLGSLNKPTEQLATTVVKERLAGRRRGLRTGVRMRAFARHTGLRWRSWYVWIPTLAVLIASTTWSAAWGAPDAVASAIVVTLVAIALALITHAAGHALAAAVVTARLLPARWDAGFAVALAGLPFHVVSGPFLPERIAGADPRKGWWISLAGIIASVGAAAMTAALYAIEPLPFLRIATATHLAVAGYALIPSKPLDGERLASRPIVLAVMGLGVAVASTLLVMGQG